LRTDVAAHDREVPGVTAMTLPPRDPAGAPPPRRGGSVRRTSTLLMTWPDGLGAGLRLDGRCRDLLTAPAGRGSTVLGAADLEVHTGAERDIVGIASDPSHAGLERLVGRKGGGGLRAAIAEELPDQVDQGTPLHLLLDDLAGSTLIAGFALMRWGEHIPGLAERMRAGRGRSMAGICAGFAPGATSLLADGTPARVGENVVRVPPLAAADDPEGWHELDDHPPMAMRRARRIDVWADGGELGIDAMFRDSCWNPDGSEVAVHEYQLLATADRGTGTLTSVTARPRVLPYAECPAAAPNASWLTGTPLRGLRSEVLRRIRGTDCCTHLNDALRSLAEVPVLAAALPR
jgi:Protein of unknown function (DUF2889)